MQTDVRLFLFETKRVRTLCDLNEDLWFVAADVCRVLEIANPRDAIRVLDADEKGVVNSDTLGGPQFFNTISEPGLYKLIARSHKPEAKRFDRWVRHEVLPTIRRTGNYGLPNASQIGGIVKSVVGKQVEALEAKLMHMEQRMNALVIEHDTRVAAVEYRPMLSILIEQKVPQKKRRGLSQRCSARLHKFCASRSIPLRISPETGRYLFHVDAARDWLHAEGQTLIHDHIAAVIGQSVLHFPKSV